jgi:hypothetical protein
VAGQITRLWWLLKQFHGVVTVAANTGNRLTAKDEKGWATMAAKAVNRDSLVVAEEG